MMAPVFFLLLGAVSVFAVRQDKDYEYTDRIIGGVPTVIEEFPFLVGLLYSRRYDGTMIKNALCAGTLLTEVWVLTSAFCADSNMKLTSGGRVRLTHIRAGSSYKDKGGMVRRVSSIKLHDNPLNDIALVKVEVPWPLGGEKIRVARLPGQDDPIPVGGVATIMGWGSTDKKSTPADILRKDDVLIISTESCNKRLMKWSKNKYGATDSNICTASHPMEKVSSVYRNDPGGPVLVRDEVVGIVSWFDGGKPPFVPNVHTRVSLYIDWINENLALHHNYQY